jgi:hypothetical protein
MISSQTIAQTGKLLVPVSNLIITRKSTEAILMPASGAHSFALSDVATCKIYVYVAEKLSQQLPSISVIFETGPS